MDKQKEIEEMAKELKELAKIIRVVLENRTDIKYIPDLDFPIAKEVLKHYRKIDKDSVVLSRAEYEQLLNKECLRGWIWKEGFNDGKKLYSETLACMRDTIENQKVELENKGKETAEKVIKAFINVFNDEFRQYKIEYNSGEYVVEETIESIVKFFIAKQFGVEIKE